MNSSGYEGYSKSDFQILKETSVTATPTVEWQGVEKQRRPELLHHQQGSFLPCIIPVRWNCDLHQNLVLLTSDWTFAAPLWPYTDGLRNMDGISTALDFKWENLYPHAWNAHLRRPHIIISSSAWTSRHMENWHGKLGRKFYDLSCPGGDEGGDISLWALVISRNRPKDLVVDSARLFNGRSNSLVRKLHWAVKIQSYMTTERQPNIGKGKSITGAKWRLEPWRES